MDQEKLQQSYRMCVGEALWEEAKRKLLMWEQELIRKVFQTNQPLEYLARCRLYKEQEDKLKRLKWIQVAFVVIRAFMGLSSLDLLELLKRQRLDIQAMCFSKLRLTQTSLLE